MFAFFLRIYHRNANSFNQDRPNTTTRHLTMEVGTGGDMATQSPSSVVMVLADAPPEPSAKGSASRDTTAAAAQVAQESNSQSADLCVVKKGDVNAAPLPPRSDPPDALADAPSTPKTPQTPASSVQYACDNAEHNNIAEEQDDADEDDGDSSSDEEEYERTPTGASRFLPPDTTDTYQESPVKFRPVFVLEKESQRSPRKKLMAADASQNEYVEGGKRSADGLESIGLPTIDEAMGPSSINGTKSSGTRPPLSGSSAGKNSNRRSRRSTASGSNGSSRGGSGRTSTTNTTGGDILTAILDRTLTLMGCASTSNAFSCGRAGSRRKNAAGSCRCGGGSADDDVLWDGDVDDTATVNSVHVPSPRASPRASPKQMADLNGRVQIQMRTSAAVGDTSGTIAHQAATAAAAAASVEGKSAHYKTNRNTKSRGMGCTGTGGKYVASSPLTTTVPFDANDLSTIVPDASDAHHLPTTTTTTTTTTTSISTEEGDGSAASPKGGTADDDDDDNDEALLSPTHFFRPVSFDIDESSLAGSIAGSLASAIRGVR